MKSQEYSDLLDTLDAAVHTGEILFTNLEEFEQYLEAWQRVAQGFKDTDTQSEDTKG